MMKIQQFFVLIMALSLSIPFTAYAERNDSDAGKRLVLNLVGSGKMYQSSVPDIDGDGKDDPAMCFDVKLYDVHTNKIVGEGTDCLAMVTPVGDSVALVGTTYFHLPGGTLVSRGETSVRSVFHPTVTPRGMTVSHITGASSDSNSIIDGTGRFANASGTVRLSGMVNMANFSGNVGERIEFDCLFVIDLE